MRKAEGGSDGSRVENGMATGGKKSRRPREDEISSSGWVVEARTVLVAATTEISVFVDDGSIVSAPFFLLLHFQGRSSKRTIVDSLPWSGLLLVFSLSHSHPFSFPSFPHFFLALTREILITGSFSEHLVVTHGDVRTLYNGRRREGRRVEAARKGRKRVGGLTGEKTFISLKTEKREGRSRSEFIAPMRE